MPAAAKKPEASVKKLKKDLPVIRIDRTMRVAEILALLPDSANLLAQYGLSCFSCSANASENLEQGWRSHGYSDEELDDLVIDLNEMLKDRPERPLILTLTKDGALKLREMLDAEGKSGWGLLVGLDETGGFSMEFVEKKNKDDQTFQCDDVPDVKLFASATTLFSIGGSTIDFREGRFKLDLPVSDVKTGCGCEGEGGCGCESGSHSAEATQGKGGCDCA